jgi:aspartyl-tRNA synthetase
MYAMPQSPQLYKQLLMASGMEKYVQFARCFRDEDLRADRQPEFTQLDLEMSFTDETQIQDVIERMLAYVYKKVFNRGIRIPFARLTYNDAFAMFGSDKPDIRFELPIKDCTDCFIDTELNFLSRALEGDGKVGALHIKAREFSRSEFDSWITRAQALGAKGLLYIVIKDKQHIESPIAKFIRSRNV